MKDIVFVVNPHSGSAGKEQILDAIVRRLDNHRFASSVRMTEYAGHASEIARQEAQRGTDIVVAVGGDGTVNEIGKSLVGTSTALGIIPCGSGNGLARHLRISMDAAEAIDVINKCCISTIDYGTINDDVFFCTCGVGFDAFISMKFAESSKRGLITYVEKTLRDGLRYRPETYRIEMDGMMQEHEAFLIACANASQYGNNAYIAPEASTRDGLMDITILTPFTAIEAPQIAMQMFSRELPRNSHVKTFRASHVRIHRTALGPAHVDGEPIVMGQTLDVSIVPAALRVVVNGEPGHRPLAFPVIHSMRRELGEVGQLIEGTFFRHIVEPFHRFDRKWWGNSSEKR